MSHSFRAFLDSFKDSWKNSSLDDLKKLISIDYQAREVRNEIIIDFGYDESINGWEQAFNEFRGKDAIWVLNEERVMSIKENEVMAIMWASLIIEGKSLETGNLFFQTFRQENYEWKLVRSYIETGIRLEKMQVL
jgi:hypothetical protein